MNIDLRQESQKILCLSNSSVSNIYTAPNGRGNINMISFMALAGNESEQDNCILSLKNNGTEVVKNAYLSNFRRDNNNNTNNSIRFIKIPESSTIVLDFKNESANTQGVIITYHFN